MKKSLSFLTALSILLMFSCEGKKANNPNKGNKVVLQVGDIKISQSEFAEIADKKKEDVEINEQKEFSQDAFDQWLENFIDNRLIEDYAIKHRYHQDKDLLYKCAIFDKAYLVQIEGDYYKQTILENADIDYIHVEKFQKNRFNGINFEYIYFKTEEDRLNALGKDTACQTLQDFERIKKRAENKGIKIQNITSTYPFQEFPGHRDKLMNMEDNQVLGSLVAYLSPYYSGRFYIKKIGEGEIRDNGEKFDEKLIWHWLQQNQCEYLFNKKMYAIFEESKFCLNEALIEKSFTDIKYTPESMEIDSLAMSEYLDSVALRFQINKEQQTYTVRDFIKFYSALPLKREFESKADYREYYIDIVIYDYIWKEANESNYVGDELNKKRERMICRNACEKLLADSVYSFITISDDEVLKRYEADSALLSFPKTVQYSKLTFQTFDDAHAVYDSIVKSLEKPEGLDITQLTGNGMIDILHKLKIGMDTITQSNPYAAFKTTNITNITKSEGLFSFAVKTGTEGSVRLELEDVSGIIKNTIKQEKYSTAKKAFAEELRLKTRLQNDINYSDYF